MNLGGVFSWYRAQRLDEELYGGHQALLTEGLPPSIALFLVCPDPKGSKAQLLHPQGIGARQLCGFVYDAAIAA